MLKFSLALFSVLAVAATASAATCTTTDYFTDGVYLTAALVNPSGTVTGEVDATGCNIAVYYNRGNGQIKKADIHGSNYYGVLVNGDAAAVSVDVLNSYVHDIGEMPLNGTQHGLAIYYRAFGTGTASGKISGNTVARYQKNGITVNGDRASGSISDNIVNGEGRIAYIAQNGIQVGWGADAQVMRNTVTGNAYTGPNGASSTGILVFGGLCYGAGYATGTQIVGNVLVNNDVGVYLSNLDFNCGAPATSTNVKVINNTITNDALTNLSGLGTQGYQAGIVDQGNNDKIINNTISGIGYTAPGNANTFATPIDADALFTRRPKIHANK